MVAQALTFFQGNFESSISRNKKFFRSSFFLFFELRSFLLKYNESFILGRYKFLNIRAKKVYFPNCKKI